MNMKTVVTHRFIKGEDLNHHGTFFAGRAAEWFVEAGLITAADLIPPEDVVLVKINSMEFVRPVKLGETLRFDSAIVYAGRSSMIAHIRASAAGTTRLEGFITFVSVDEAGRPKPHGIVIEPADGEERALQEKAKALKAGSPR